MCVALSYIIIIPMYVPALALRWPRVQKEPGSPLPYCTIVNCGSHLHRASGGQGILLSKWMGVTANQMDRPSQTLMPLSVAGYGRLQLGAAHSYTSVALQQKFLI